jgi:uncharacterized membrane protein HdeD (DUF308 family)
MKLFPLDVITGTLLVISLLLIVLGIVIYRYRRGPGPILLVLSGTLIFCSSVLDILVKTEVLRIWDGSHLIVLGIGILAGIASLTLWRR